jgi:deazaflavin-dependent oxidoreductase (nitroreductase family)
MPKIALMIFKATSFLGDLMFRAGMKVQGRPLLRLGTVGARSGKQRRSVLGWFPDEGRDDAWIVVASNAGGARHPAWAYNLVNRPDSATVDAGEGEVPVSVEMLTGAERDRVWRRIADSAPGYGRYEEKTDREIPLFRLTPGHDDAR